MGDEVFSFTPDQKTNLEKWVAFLDTERAREWDIEEKDAIESIHSILKETRFGEGNDLSSEDLDDIFRKTKLLIRNMALNRKLYEDNGLINFNSRLRKLLFGSEPLVERVDQFLSLKLVGKLTVSQFLCSFNPTEYPEVGWQTLEVLGLDSTQLNTAYKQALTEHNISSPDNYRNDTLEYLRDMVIFREIRNTLNLTDYNRINDLLWLARRDQIDVEGELKPFPMSVSLEKDLRDFIAANPSMVENGLSLVKKEYDIKGAGSADLLCKDKRGNYVVIETKRGRESDKVVGQILRYVGGLRIEGKRARGVIVVNEPDSRLDFAVEAVKDFIKLKYYKVQFEVTDTYTKGEFES